jgi:hypothetical protein
LIAQLRCLALRHRRIIGSRWRSVKHSSRLTWTWRASAPGLSRAKKPSFSRAGLPVDLPLRSQSLCSAGSRTTQTHFPRHCPQSGWLRGGRNCAAGLPICHSRGSWNCCPVDGGLARDVRLQPSKDAKPKINKPLGLIEGCNITLSSSFGSRLQPSRIRMPRWRLAALIANCR